MNQRAWLRLGAKTVHDIASIGFGGALAACLVINLTTSVATPGAFQAARQIFSAIAQYILVPSGQLLPQTSRFGPKADISTSKCGLQEARPVCDAETTAVR